MNDVREGFERLEGDVEARLQAQRAPIVTANEAEKAALVQAMA